LISSSLVKRNRTAITTWTVIKKAEKHMTERAQQGRGIAGTLVTGPSAFKMASENSGEIQEK
jgi:hypothetical protein